MPADFIRSFAVCRRGCEHSCPIPRHGVSLYWGLSGHFLQRNESDGGLLSGPLHLFLPGESSSTAPSRLASGLTCASRRVPHMPPHCAHVRFGTLPALPADRILALWQSRAPCTSFRVKLVVRPVPNPSTPTQQWPCAVSKLFSVLFSSSPFLCQVG